MAERLRVHPQGRSQIRIDLTVHRVCLIYELAYLRAFNQWESFLEDTLLRYVCGYSFAGIVSQPLIAHSPTLAAARTLLYANAPYLLWHSPTTAAQRAQNHLHQSNYETVLTASAQIISDYAGIRHRIAHDQTDAKQKFDVITMNLVGQRFLGSRPGLFLRTKTQFNQQDMRWLERICAELSGIAMQLAP